MEGKMTVYIYGLWDPRTYELRYIGKSYNPEKRLEIHIQDAKRNLSVNFHKDRWIKQLLSENLEPSLEILEECSEDNWSDIERIWIREAREKGVNLINLAEGGEGGNNGVDISGENNPRWGKEVSDKTRKLMSDKLKETYNDKTRTPWYGKHLSDEHKRNVSESKKGKKIHTLESLENLRKKFSGPGNPMFGGTHTEESRKKLSESNKKYWASRIDRTQPKEQVKKRILSIRIMWAYKKGQIDKLILLQKEYFDLFGYYYPRYPHE